MKRLLPLLLICLLCGCHAPQEETQFLMDTVCTIRAGGSNADSAISAAFAEIKEIQDAVNLYDEASTVSQFNRAKAGEAIPLDIHTATILKTALAVAEASSGAFDITIAPVSSLWDFHQGILPDADILSKNLSLVGWEYLIFDPSAQTLTKTKDGVAIDLGGAAKGYAADRAAAVLKEQGVTYALLNLGGNIYVFGKNPNRSDGTWQVGIQKPFADTGVYTNIHTLSEGAVVTSGIYQRNFTQDGVLYHHILDPKTGYPFHGELAGATVCADSALLADCLSTACLILGEEDAQKLAEQFHTTLYLEPRP